MGLFLALAAAWASPAGAGDDRQAAAPAPQAAQGHPEGSAVARALEELASEDWLLQYRAIRQLARWKVREARAPLEAILAGRAHPWVRGRALVALGEILGEAMLDAAFHHARSEHAELRAAAVEALGVIGSPRGDAAAAAALEDKAPEVRCQAVLAVARLRKAAAWPIVQPLLNEPDPKLLRYGARALRDVGTAPARQALRPLLEHADALVRLEAVEAIGAFRDPQDVEALLARRAVDESTFVRQKAQEALALYPPEVLRPRLLGALREAAKGHDAAALAVLAAAADQESRDAVAALVRASPRRYKDVIRPILALLGEADADRYHNVLAAYLADPESRTRAEAVQHLARCRKIDLFAALAPLLTDASATVRGQVISSLAQATGGAPAGGMLTYLAAPLRDESWEVRKRAIDLLADRVTPAELTAGLDTLACVLGAADASLRSYAAKALSRVGDEETRRRLADAQGYITDWRILGPFPNDKDNRGFTTAFPPEWRLDFERVLPEWQFDRSAVFEAVRDRAGKAQSLRIAPPEGGPGAKTVVTCFLNLPAAGEVRAAMTVSRGEGDGRPGAVAVSLRADGKVLASAKLLKSGDANTLEAPLDGMRGKSVELELVVEALDQDRPDAALVGPARIVADGKTAADLAELGAAAPARTQAAHAQPQKLQWESYRAPGVWGELALHDLFPPPTHYHVAYAAAELVSDAQRDVVLEIAADDACAVWLNGAEVHRQAAGQPGKVKVQLRHGANRLLVKVANLVDWWYCTVRVVDGAGQRAAGVRAAPPDGFQGQIPK